MVGVQRIMLMKLYMLAAEYLVFSIVIKSPFLVYQRKKRSRNDKGKMGIMVEFVREEPSGMDRGQQISGERGVWKVLGVEGI